MTARCTARTLRALVPGVASGVLVIVACATFASGCAGLGWGEGGAEPTRATAGALVRTVDQAMLTRASERLAERVVARWGTGPLLTSIPAAFAIDWSGWQLAPGGPRLELLPPGPSTAAANGLGAEFGLLVHLPIAADSHEIQLSAEFLDQPCGISVLLAAGELDIPMGFTADKLGRIQGVVLPGASYHALSDVTPNAILKADLSACIGAVDPGAQLAALGSAFADAAVRAVSDAMSSEVGGALGLDLAFAWSAAVNADALGTGFMRTALRGLANDLVARQAEALQFGFALTVEADAHPCMGSLALPDPRAEVAESALPAGAALHIASLERLIAASWLAGAACADHLGVIPVASGPLVATWPELARLGPDAEVSLELWPAALPRVTVDAAMVDGLVLDTGRVRAEIMVTYAGARWRAASVVVDLSVAGSLWIGEAGAVTFDPAAVEALPLTVEAGFLGAPEGDVLAALLPPLIEALVLGRPLARLPAALAPVGESAVTVSGDFLSWPTR